MIKTAVNSISAGILIAIGGSVYLACDNKYAGAALFSVALLCICYLGYYLFTGKIGYLATDRSKKNALSLALGLAVNLAVTFLLGMLIRFAMPALGEKAATLCGNALLLNAAAHKGLLDRTDIPSYGAFQVPFHPIHSFLSGRAMTAF